MTTITPPLLVLDAHYLCHRAFHSQRDLAWNGAATGVIYGFLRSIQSLKAEFQTDRIAFCFESRNLHRYGIFPDYKKQRRHENEEPEKIRARTELVRQIDDLRTSHLKEIGFRNVFSVPGFESDDLMAAIARDHDRVILVTSDTDMYQCIGRGKTMYSPHTKRLLTLKWFIKTHGIEPWQWARVKAMAGCDSDGVPGIRGVGERTAIRWLRKEIDRESKVAARILQSGELIERNLQLVRLPFNGCPSPRMHKDRITVDGWKSVCDKLGFQTLVNNVPVFNRHNLA